MTFVDRARSFLGMGPRRVQFSSSELNPKPLDLAISQMLNSMGRVSRADALSVPAIKRGRDIICGLATLPLETVDSRRKVVGNTILPNIDPMVADAVTVAQTIEDLLFEARSFWYITDFDDDGWPIHARHLDVSLVDVKPTTKPSPLPSGLDPRGEYWYDGKRLSPEFVIQFHSLNTPLLRDSTRPVRRAVALDKAAEMYANDPRPMDYFTPADKSADPDDDEGIQKALDDWAKYRRSRATGYVPAAVVYNEVNQPTPADLQLVELQKRAALDIANCIGLDPEDLGVSTTSRTYQNAVDRRQDRINDVLSSYAAAITGRLSMPDVTKPGHKVRFDFDGYLRADPLTRAQVQQIYHGMGVITEDEIRTEEGMPALTSDQRKQLEAVKVKSTLGKPVNQIGAGNGAA